MVIPNRDHVLICPLRCPGGRLDCCAGVGFGATGVHWAGMHNIKGTCPACWEISTWRRECGITNHIDCTAGPWSSSVWKWGVPVPWKYHELNPVFSLPVQPPRRPEPALTPRWKPGVTPFKHTRRIQNAS